MLINDEFIKYNEELLKDNDNEIAYKLDKYYYNIIYTLLFIMKNNFNIYINEKEEIIFDERQIKNKEVTNINSNIISLNLKEEDREEYYKNILVLGNTKYLSENTDYIQNPEKIVDNNNLFITYEQKKSNNINMFILYYSQNYERWNKLISNNKVKHVKIYKEEETYIPDKEDKILNIIMIPIDNTYLITQLSFYNINIIVIDDALYQDELKIPEILYNIKYNMMIFLKSSEYNGSYNSLFNSYLTNSGKHLMNELTVEKRREFKELLLIK